MAPSPPVNLQEYQRAPRTGSPGYPLRTIITYNLQRALNGDLGAAERAESLRLVNHLGGDDPAVRKDLALILSNPQAPPELHRTVLEFLLEKDHPDLAAHVLRVLPNLGDQGELLEAVLDWLVRHPQPEVLAEVVKIWAREESVTGPNESRYRSVVERMMRMNWDDALLHAINTPAFYARGSAIEVLTQRVSQWILRRQIARIQPRTDACRALQVFLREFDYLPTNGRELLRVAWLYKTRKDMIPPAGRLGRTWTTNSGYRFGVRDFHLLSRLAGDPLRKKLRRAQLIAAVGEALGARRHVHARRTGQAGKRDDDFWRHAESLSMSDLWNLHLLNEMLSRRRVRVALRIMADRIRRDPAGRDADAKKPPARDGLIFYENGQAEAKLYPLSQKAREGDLEYLPSRRAEIDARDALLRFHARFEKLDLADLAGPTGDELIRAHNGSYCGLVLTGTGKTTFCAHYYNSRGLVISLGQFEFEK